LSSIEKKKEQLNAFYLIAYPIKANVVELTSAQSAQSMSVFEQEMPYAFRIAGEMAEIQSNALKPLRGLGEKMEDLVAYLQFQAKKIDLMMSYILQQQDEPANRVNAIKFGGGGCVIEHEKPIAEGEGKAIKLFLESESAAVYAYAEAIESIAFNDVYQTSYIFTHIREQDQELLVRASLHLQTQALRAVHDKKSS
jgi:hypothetical protein